MVELNFHRRHPEALIDLGRIQGLGEVSRDDGWLRFGPVATYDQLTAALREDFPALAYRTRALQVLAARILDWVWTDYLKAGPG